MTRRSAGMTRTVKEAKRRRRAANSVFAAVAGIGALTAAIVVVGAPGGPSAARAASSGCSNGSGNHPCVILIEVNGLEPKDVTKASTPFLWALAHSGAIDSNNDPGVSQYPALSGRNGWAWQAARTVMGTGSGPATEALLTGDTAEQDGDPADVFAVPSGSGGLTYFQTGGGATVGGGDSTGCGGPTDPCDPVTAPNQADSLASSTVLNQAENQNGETVGVWLGDPALCTIANNSLTGGSGLMYDKTPGGVNSGQMADLHSNPSGGCPHLWAPASLQASNPDCGSSPDCYQQQNPDCPPPSTWPLDQGTQYYPAACPVSDEEVLLQATQDVSQGGLPNLSFMYLNDLGLAKQNSGDSDCFQELHCDGANPSPTEPSSVSHALQSTDAALATFFGSLAESSNPTTQAEWADTVVMIVGSHGYEPTPTALRVPDPQTLNGSTPSPYTPSTSPTNLCSPPQATGLGDLSCYVAEASGNKAVLVPQGTMGTIYYTGASGTQDEEQTLRKLYAGLCDVSSTEPTDVQDTCSSNSDVNLACQKLLAAAQQAPGQLPSNPVATPSCVDHVYYTDPSWIPASDAANGALPIPAPASGTPQQYLDQFLFGMPGDPGYPTSSDPSYDPNPHCQSTDSGAPFYDASNCDPNLLSFYEKQQGSWHLNALNPLGPNNTPPFASSGAGGQMVVQLSPGWAAGPLVGVGYTSSGAITFGGAIPEPVSPVGMAADAVDPYLASGGGPRDRAVAAIVNGPASATAGDPVVQFPDATLGQSGTGDGLAPAMSNYNQSQDATRNVCDPAGFMMGHATYQDQAPSTSGSSPSGPSLAVDQANADPGNDSAAFGSPEFNSQSDSYVPGPGGAGTGFECQAQTIDFALTIEGLQGIQNPVPPEQADARFLDEAFAKCVGGLAPPNTASGPLCGFAPSLGNGNVQQVVVPPPVVLPPPVTIVIPPKLPPAYDFHGLIRNVQAQVVDQHNNTVPFAPPGAYLSSIRITADFGKPESEVTITLYHGSSQRAASRRGTSAHSSRTPLTAIVRFCPFTVQRAPDVQLRFEVPPAYQPDHVGLTVREVHMLPKATAPGCVKGQHSAFVAFGGFQGALVPILDAQLLHKHKPCPGSFTVSLPHGPGVTVQSATIIDRKRVVMAIPRSELGASSVTIPATTLPGGVLQVRVQWLQAGGRKAATETSVSNLVNCTAAERHWIGQANARAAPGKR